MGQGKLKMLWKVREKSGNFERVMAMVVSWVIWNILDNILIHCWWSCWHQWLGCQAPMIHWIFHWCQISFVILFAKLCLNSYGTRVNQYCESNVTRGQGKQKMVREKSGKSQEVLSGAIAGHPDATWRILWRHGCALHYTCWAPHEWRTYSVYRCPHGHSAGECGPKVHGIISGLEGLVAGIKNGGGRLNRWRCICIHNARVITTFSMIPRLA